mgnify:CR=1 FL=1
MILKRLFLFLFCIFLNLSVFAESDNDQWQDSDKTYFDLIQEGFEVKAYDITNIKVQNNYILMFFVSVLQKNNSVYECQEYQTLDMNMQTLDMNFICKQLVQPYKKGLGT